MRIAVAILGVALVTTMAPVAAQERSGAVLPRPVAVFARQVSM